MKLNGTEVLDPEEMKVNPVEYGVSARTASGRYVKDIIAIKNSYTLTYKGLKSTTASVFKNVYLSGNSVPFEYKDSDGIKTVQVSITSLPYSILKHNTTLNQNVTITLEEV